MQIRRFVSRRVACSRPRFLCRVFSSASTVESLVKNSATAALASGRVIFADKIFRMRAQKTRLSVLFDDAALCDYRDSGCRQRRRLVSTAAALVTFFLRKSQRRSSTNPRDQSDHAASSCEQLSKSRRHVFRPLASRRCSAPPPPPLTRYSQLIIVETRRREK